MPPMKAAVFSHNGLGDGVNLLVLSNNLHLNGYQVDTFHNTLGSMQNWFPHLPVLPYPAEVSGILATYDYFFVVWNDADEFVKRLIVEGKRRFPERVKVFYFYPSSNIINEPYYEDCRVDPTLSVAKNLRNFCEQIFHLPKITKSNGFISPQGLHFRKHAERVVIHPTCARPSKSWDKKKFVKLALHLKNCGFQSVFVPGSKEVALWEGAVDFPTLDALASYIYESSYLIGNDSGLAHLASALGIPTMTVCRRKTQANLWAPSFTKGIVLTPSSLIPNIRGLRLRDRHWQKFITVNRARRGFEKLVTL
jgi:heptosyltransferase-3